MSKTAMKEKKPCADVLAPPLLPNGTASNFPRHQERVVCGRLSPSSSSGQDVVSVKPRFLRLFSVLISSRRKCLTFREHLCRNLADAVAPIRDRDQARVTGQ